jgi:hypothetical protein
MHCCSFAHLFTAGHPNLKRPNAVAVAALPGRVALYYRLRVVE